MRRGGGLILAGALLAACAQPAGAPASATASAARLTASASTSSPAPSAARAPTVTASVLPSPSTSSAGSPAPATASACALPAAVTWKATEGEYAGPIFDAHFHLFVDRRLTPTNAGSEGLCRFLDKLGIQAALGFYALPAASPPRTNLIVAQSSLLVETARTRVVPMLEMGADVPDLFSAQSTFARGAFTDAVLQGYLTPAWVFQGVGEIPENVWDSPGIDSAPMQTALRNVNAKSGIVMIHAWPKPIGVAQQRAKIEAAVRSSPNVTFLFHGPKSSFDFIEPLLQKLPSVYFSWDGGPGWMAGSWGSLMHPGATPQNPTGTGGSTAQFLADVQRVGMDRVVNENLSFLQGALQKYPDRITGAMDLNAPWHFDDASSRLIVKTFRTIVAKLPPEMQERYAYRNAMAAFGSKLGR